MIDTDVWLGYLENRVGETEHPLGSNCCAVCRDYGSLGVSCYAWCCALQDLAQEATFGERLLGTASVGQAKTNAQAGKNGLLWIPRSAIEHGEDLRVGDLPCYDYKGHGNWNDFHIEGIVNPYTNKRFQTIGGNRQNRCDYWWNTLNSTVMGVIRPPYKSTGLGPLPTPPITQGEHSMAAACLDKNFNSWHFYVDDGRKCSSFFEGKPNNRLLGDADPGWRSIDQAVLNPSTNEIAVCGVNLDGAVAQIVFTPGSKVKPLYNVIGGHVYTP